MTNFYLVKLKYSVQDLTDNVTVLALTSFQMSVVERSFPRLKFPVPLDSLLIEKISGDTYAEVAPFLNSTPYALDLIDSLESDSDSESDIEPSSPKPILDPLDKSLTAIPLGLYTYYNPEHHFYLEMSEDGPICKGTYDPETKEITPLTREEQDKCFKLGLRY